MVNDKYAKRGVSSQKEDVHEAIKGLDKGLFPMAFCKILPDIAGGNTDYVNIIHADTAGTKTALAYIYWKETGDASVWKGIAQDSLVMNLDDMACAGVTDNFLISSTIGRNKALIPGEVIKAIIEGTTDFISNMQQFGISIAHGGGETADVGDIVQTIDVGITAFARMPKEKVIVNDIKPGNVIVGVASYGKASYEDAYNGGMGSNGLTSARHDVFSKVYADKYPESFNPLTDRSYIYSGTKMLSDIITLPDGTDITAGKLVLSPTRTYLPLIKEIIAKHAENINGMIHCTGGGQSKVLHFAGSVHIIKNNLLPLPPLFVMIQSESGTEWRDMYTVFNMGHRLEVYTDERTAASIIDQAHSFEMDAQIIGYVEDSETKKLTIDSPYGVFTY